MYFEEERARREMVEPDRGFAAFMARSNLRDMETMLRELDGLAQHADGIVSTPLVMAAHLVAQKRKLPFVSCALSPAMLLANWKGAYDPYAKEWRHCLNELRKTISLPRRSFPQMDRFSADLTLGVYPKCLATTEARFIREPCDVGYPCLDDFDDVVEVKDDLREWMANGPFVLVSFGSFVDERSVEIFHFARRACADLGLRLLFISRFRAAELACHEEPGVRVESYVPHQIAMRRATVVVHHCGVGTLAAAGASGRPMIAVPFGLDQLHNAEVVNRRDLADVFPGNSLTYEQFRDAICNAQSRWPERVALWRPWLDDSGVRSAHRAMEHVEALLSARA